MRPRLECGKKNKMHNNDGEEGNEGNEDNGLRGEWRRGGEETRTRAEGLRG